MSEMIECPGEAHELDGGFNPTTQGPYYPGYHECDLCWGENEITIEDYEDWKELQKKLEEDRKHRELITAFSRSKKLNY